MTLSDQIKHERKALNSNKLEMLRNMTLNSRQVNFIKPSRPDRKGLNSEIIIETKIANGELLLLFIFKRNSYCFNGTSQIEYILKLHACSWRAMATSVKCD